PLRIILWLVNEHFVYHPEKGGGAKKMDWMECVVIPELYRVRLRQYYKDVSIFAVAVDSEREVQEALAELHPDEDPLVVLQVGDTLWEWLLENRLLIKRRKSALVARAMQPRLAQSSMGSRTTEVYQQLLATDLELVRRVAKTTFGRGLKTEGAGRADLEKAETLRWTAQLAEYITEGGLPAAHVAVETGNIPQTWARLFGARRPSTLRNVARTWKRFRTWLHLVQGRAWPRTPADVMAYLEERALEPCGPTVPGTILSALGLLESVGGLPKEQRLSLDPVLINFVDGLRKDLETGAPPKKTAQCYSIAMLISAELQVADIQVSLVDRIFSWIFLLMIWTAMRADDVQWLDRRRFCFSELGLRGTLTRSKISGPGRKIRELPVFVHRFANLSGFDWLQIGFDLYEEVSRDFPEDMFITLPHIGGASFSRRYIKVTDFNSWIKAAMAKFRTPKRAEGLWTATEELLLPREMLNFWTGHSPRHCLVSWAAAVGIPAEKRSYLGRWHAASDTSDMF
ncbi:unnamed protein product, partial [Effrenium voratum]